MVPNPSVDGARSISCQQTQRDSKYIGLAENLRFVDQAKFEPNLDSLVPIQDDTMGLNFTSEYSVPSSNANFSPSSDDSEEYCTDDVACGFSNSMFSAQPLSPSPSPQAKQNKKRRAPPSPHYSEYDYTRRYQDEDSSGENDDTEGEEKFKRRHNESERKRQATINDAISQIKEIIVSDVSYTKRMSKGAILKKTVDYLTQKNNQSARLKEENAALLIEHEHLTKQIDVLQEILRAHGLTNALTTASYFA